MAARSRKFVFLGYSAHIKGFLLLDINTKVVFISNDVQFYENIFPFKEKGMDEFNCNNYAHVLPDSLGVPSVRATNILPREFESQELNAKVEGSSELLVVEQNMETDNQFNPEGLVIDLGGQINPSYAEAESEHPRRSSKNITTPLRYQDCYCGLLNS